MTSSQSSTLIVIVSVTRGFNCQRPDVAVAAFRQPLHLRAVAEVDGDERRMGRHRRGTRNQLQPSHFRGFG